MSFESIVTERLTAITNLLNSIIANSKTNEEYPEQTTLEPASNFRVSNAGVSQHLKIQRLLDYFQSLGYITLQDIYQANIILESSYYWVEDYTYRVVYVKWIKDSEFHEFHFNQNFILSDAHATLDRIDIIALNTDSETIEIVEGTPASEPSPPALNENQLQITFVPVGASTTAPTGVTETLVYNENGQEIGGEFDTSTNNPTDITLNYPDEYQSGALSIKWSNVAIDDYVNFDKSSTLDIGDYSFLIFRVKLFNVFNHKLQVSLRTQSPDASIFVINILHGNYGFDINNLSTWQTIVVPLHGNIVASLATDFDRIRITNKQADASFLIDNVVMQSGTEGSSGEDGNFLPRGGYQGTAQDLKDLIDLIGSTPGIITLTGDSVDNTDPNNPVVNAIPLSGTEVGSPVTGDIEFDNSSDIIKLRGNVNNERIEFVDDGNIEIYSGDSVFNFVAINGFAINQAEGIATNTYIAPSTDNTYVQKKYVDDNFVPISEDIVEVATYEDIPLEEATYLINTELPSNPPEPPYELSLNTNVYRFDDGYRYKIKELVTVNKAIVIREIVGKRTDINQIFFKDSFYVAGTGEFIGECFYSVLQVNGEEYVEHYFNVADTLRIPFNNYYIKNENSKNKGFLNLPMSDVDVEDGLIITKIPFSQNITKAHIFLDSKEISGARIGIFKGFLSVNYNNGELVNKILFKNLTLRFDFEIIGSTLNNNSYLTRGLLNSKLNAVNAETTQVHSDAMSKTFNEIYDINNGFPNQIYKDTYGNILNFKEKDKINGEILNTNCDIIFSAEPLFFTELRSYYTEPLITLPVGSNTLARIDLTSHIDEFPPNYIAVTSRAETDNDGTDPLGTSYGFGTEFNEPTLSADLTAQGLTDWPGSQEHQQSPATAIVAGKLKKIKDETGAPWDIVREAARQTASNAGSYNIYRGFGVIDVNAAIAAIPAMLDARSLELAEYFEATSKFPKELKYQDKGDNTPVVKRDIENYNDFLRLSIPYTSSPQIIKGSLIFENLARFTFGKSFQMWSNGSEGRLTLLSHDLKIRDGATERFSFERTTGTFKANKFHLNDLNTAPASSTAPGTKGEIRITADYIYVCVAANTWKRTALSTW